MHLWLLTILKFTVGETTEIMSHLILSYGTFGTKYKPFRAKMIFKKSGYKEVLIAKGYKREYHINEWYITWTSMSVCPSVRQGLQ